jgi:hypothetical protein
MAARDKDFCVAGQGEAEHGVARLGVARQGKGFI